MLRGVPAAVLRAKCFGRRKIRKINLSTVFAGQNVGVKQRCTRRARA
jgi:hypothetical protein